MTESDRPSQVVLVEAPTRFAVIAPGLPIPRLVIASSEQVSDLVGFYSLREAGLESILGPHKSNLPSLNHSLFGIIRRPDSQVDPYISYDLWIEDNPNDRKKLYSLIIHNPGFSHSTIDILDSFNEKLTAQLERVVKAYTKGDGDEIIYLGQMLATFVSLLLDRLNFEDERLKRRRAFLSGITGMYVTLAGAIGIILLAINAINAKSGGSISEWLRTH